MPRKAKVYIGLTIVAGVCVGFRSAAGWQDGHLTQFLVYLAFAALSANLKVSLPGVTGTLSVHFLFVLISVACLNLPQTVLVGCAAAVAQCSLRTKTPPSLAQLVFNLSNAAITAALCFWVYHSTWLRAVDDSESSLLFWASATYFLANTFPVAGVIGLTEGKRTWNVWHDSFFWTAPQYVVGAALVWAIQAANRAVGWQTAVLVLPAIFLVYRSYRLYLGRLEAEKQQVNRIAALHLRTIRALALAIEAKDESTHDHLRRVQVYATEIAREMGLTESEVQAVRAAALLHDIGKLAVPEYILSKPGRLTPEEFERMKIHPVVGAAILETVEFPYAVAPLVRAHHERWDGQGYPDGLQGEAIPMGSRILAAVDALDAMASGRPYRAAIPLEDAVSHLAVEAGKAFDPRVVRILERRYVELEAKASAAADEHKRVSRGRVLRGQSPAASPLGSSEPREPEGGFISSIAAARQEFQMLHEITRDLGTSLNVEQTFSFLAAHLKGLVPYDAIAIYVLQDGRLVPKFTGGQDTRLFSSLAIPMGQGLSGWVAENAKPILNGNPSVECGYLADVTKFSTLRSALSVPLEGGSGVVGVLTLYRAEANAFSNDNLRILLAINSKAALTIQNAIEFRQAQDYATTDELTGLANARALMLELDKELARCKRTGEALAVMVLDLDGFKQVNDRFGHLQGNHVLREVASAVRASCREYDFVARMGGDEFVLILPGIAPAALHGKSQALCEIVAGVARSTGCDVLGLSVGEAVYPADGSDVEQLLAKADTRMYQVKQLHHLAAAAAGRAETGSPVAAA